MKIFLSALEAGSQCSRYRDENGNCLDSAYYFKQMGVDFKWNLMSYYYIGEDKYGLAEFIRDNSQEILIDSGAHSFQKGKKVDWVAYTHKYAEFIRKFDRPNVIGYFEMDVDGIIGYDNVLYLRQILENASDKIIPVWHDSRGAEDFELMCQKYAGKIVAISGFKNVDIQDHQYIMFLKTAKKYGCKVHCLGMTRKKILDKVPFDYTDSSSWKQNGIYGGIGKGKVTRNFSLTNRESVFMGNYLIGQEMQDYYYKKWQTVCKD